MLTSLQHAVAVQSFISTLDGILSKLFFFLNYEIGKLSFQ